MIQLEVGKRYVRRDGEVTLPLHCNRPDDDYADYVTHPFTDGMYTWRNDGRFGSNEYHLDLITEYAADYNHLGDLQREHNEMQSVIDWTREKSQERDEKEKACWEALSGMVADNQAMGMYDVANEKTHVLTPPQPDEAQKHDDANPCWWRYLKRSLPQSIVKIGEPFHVVAGQQADTKEPKPAIRTFASGATRNLDHNKLDYEGFNCPAAQRAFAEYMHTHRKQADGTMRAGDNWQKSIPVVEYMKSIKRHTQDLHLLHRGWNVTRPEDGIDLLPTTENKIELLCAIWFNVQGMIHELLKEERSHE